MKKTILLLACLISFSASNAQFLGNYLTGYLIEGNSISTSNTPITISYQCGISFNDIIYPQPSGYYNYALPYSQGCFTLSFENCSGNTINSGLFTYTPSDSGLYFTMIYCDTATGGNQNPPYELCVYAYTLDSFVSSNQNNVFEYYLIKAYSTSNGDSLALVDSYISNNNPNGGSSACFTINDSETYYVKAALIPSSPDYLFYLPTYYQSLLWSDATGILMNQSQYAVITMQQGINTGGPGFIGGYVSQGANRTDEADAAGDPIANVQMILTKVDGTPVAHAKTDANGYYSFSNIVSGVYKVWADILNRPCTPAVVSIIEVTTYNNVNFTVNNQNVQGGIATGMGSSNIKENLVLMTNPVHNVATMQASGKTVEQNLAVVITDVQGRVIRSYQAAAAYQHSVMMNDLANGIYFIQAKSDTATYRFKVVKQ